MAGLGLTKLEAVNMMLLAVGQPRASVLTATSGTDDVAEAHTFLDIIIRQCICEGHPAVTKSAYYTASAGGEIDLSSAEPLALRVRGTGKYKSRNLSILGTKVYDGDTGLTACFGNGEIVSLDVFKAASASSPNNFEDLPEDLKEKIVDRATIFYRGRKRFDPNVDAMLARDQNRSENVVARAPLTQPIPSQIQPIQFGPIGSGPR